MADTNYTDFQPPAITASWLNDLNRLHYQLLGNPQDVDDLVNNFPLADGSNNGLMSSTDKVKLDGIEENATADMTPAEIKAAYESNPDTNAFTDTNQLKLDGIEENAKDDQDALDVFYDSVDSTIIADNVQLAIDELDLKTVTHINSPPDVHPASAISYDNTFSGLLGTDVQEAIDQLGAGSVTSWNTRTGAVVPVDGDYASEQITYDNSISGLAADNVKTAIDEVSTNITAGDATKADKLPSATPGNYIEFDATGNLADSGTNPSDFAPTVHTHVEADITDLDKYTQAETDSAIATGITNHVGQSDPHPQYVTPDDLPATITGWWTDDISPADPAYLSAVGTEPSDPQSSLAVGVPSTTYVQVGQWLRDPAFTESFVWEETNVASQMDIDCDASNVEIALDFYIYRADTSEELLATSNPFTLNNARETYTLASIMKGPITINAGDRALTKMKARKTSTAGGTQTVTIYMEGDNITRAITQTPISTIPGPHASSHEVGGSDLIDHDNLTNAQGFKSHSQIDNDIGALEGDVLALQADTHTHANKAILDATTASFTTADETKLDGITANANNYTHPSFDGDDINVDTGALSGATVISDLDFNITTNTQGHVTDANATVATRNLTLANLGFTGDTNANDYTHPTNSVSNPTLTGASVFNTFATNSEGHVTGMTTRTMTPANIGAATSSQGSNADTAFSWGDHALAGYALSTDVVPVTGGTFTGNVGFLSSVSLTGVNPSISLKETDTVDNDTVLTSDGNAFQVQRRGDNGNFLSTSFSVNHVGATNVKFAGANKLTTTSQGVSVTGTVTATGGNSTNWNTAYGWGDHALAGYALASGGGSQSINTFTSSGTYTKPAGLKQVEVTVTGGGGGGGGKTSEEVSSSGAGGGTSIAIIDASSIGSTVAVTVGAAGAGGASSGAVAGTGGTSSFGAFCSATGGGGGRGNNIDVKGPNGGVGSGGDINIRGGGGSTASRDRDNACAGGASYWGGGRAARYNSGTTAAPAYGAGGGGIRSDSTADVSGESGGSGVVMIKEFF